MHKGKQMLRVVDDHLSRVPLPLMLVKSALFLKKKKKKEIRLRH